MHSTSVAVINCILQLITKWKQDIIHVLLIYKLYVNTELKITYMTYIIYMSYNV